LELLCCSIFFTSPQPSASWLFAGYSRKRATASRGTVMDYIIGGITTLLLFVYLIYALLKPEKF
jgi:K+-transporting ATPase KdpF subunit